LGTVLLAATWAAAAAPKPLWKAHCEVTFGESERGVPRADVQVTLACLRKGACPATVELTMAEDGFPKGYAAFVRGPVPFPARLPVPIGGAARLRYEVVLEHDATGWGPGPDEAPYRFDGGAFWTGRALFAAAVGSRNDVVLRAPEGRRVSTSLEPGIDEGRLRDSFLVVGTHQETRLRVGGARVTLALGGRLAGSMPAVEGAIRRFLEASGDIFGGAPPARILIVGNLGAPAGTLFGGGFGSDLSFLFPAGQQYWFTEGVTEDYAKRRRATSRRTGA
jgi:hypothetical protein